jgi:hypothetical protein
VNFDRAKFLGLVTAIAAAGCVINEKSEKENEGGGGVGGATSQGGTTSQGGGTTSQGGGGVGGATGGTGGAASGGSGGGTCDDSVGAPAACTTVTGDCEPYCNAAHANLKPAVAEAAVACLVLDQASGCYGGYDCIKQALAAACPDPATQSDCATVGTECSEPGDPSCEDVLDGLTTAARAEVMTCVNDGCSFGVWSCTEGVSFVP